MIIDKTRISITSDGIYYSYSSELTATGILPDLSALE